MSVSIKYKLLPIIVIGIISLSLVFYVFALKTQKSNLDELTLNGITSAKSSFYNLEENDVKMLKASLIDFMTNQDYKDVFIQGDRDKLYEFSKDLYAKHKELGITHFYYHNLNGTVFLRVHKPAQFNDAVKRITYLKSKETNDWGSGIELGATAFALRVVHPYYNGNDLIGYMEYGEEIDHFIKIMKTETKHEYGVVVKKQFINPVQWAGVRQGKGLPDNYNDLPNYVIIDTTKTDTNDFKAHCFNENDLNSVTDNGNVFSKFVVNDKTFVCGGFALYDADNKNVGAVVVIEDVTTIEETAKANNKNMLIVAIIATLLIGIIVVFLVTAIIIKPLDDVVTSTTKVAGGDFTAKSNVKSNDEIGELAEMIEGFKQIMINTSKELEEAHKKKK